MHKHGKLDQVDWLIVETLHLDPFKPLAAVASSLQLAEGTIRNRLIALEEEGSIRISAVIDLRPLGFHEYSLWCEGSRPLNVDRNLAFEALMKCPRVVALNDFGSDFEVVLCATDPLDLEKVIDQLAVKLCGLPDTRNLSIWNRWTILKRTSASVRRAPSEFFRAGNSRLAPNFDEIDHHILTHLGATHSRSSAADLARKVQLAERTVQYRLKRLRDAGILLGNMIIVDSQANGRVLSRLALTVSGAGPQSRVEMRCVLEQSANVLSFVECLGHWDFEAIVEGDSNGGTAHWLNTLREQGGTNLSTLKLMPFLDRPKISPYSFTSFQDARTGLDRLLPKMSRPVGPAKKEAELSTSQSTA